jgi:hypothetical protein
MTNQYTQIAAYFQSLAEDYAPIGHTTAAPRFFLNTMDSVRQDMLAASSKIMYLSDQQYTAAEQDGSHVLVTQVRVSILENYALENYAAEKAAIESCFGHVKEIMAKMMEDRRAENDVAKTFNLDDCSIFMETPVNDQWIGCTLSFTLRIDEQFEKSAAQWP